MMMPTKLTLDGTAATLIGNHQIMVVPIGSNEKISNNGMPLLPHFPQRTNAPNGPPKNVIHGNELTITTRNIIEQPMNNNTSSNDSSVTIVETSDSDMNGKINFKSDIIGNCLLFCFIYTSNILLHMLFIFFHS